VIKLSSLTKASLGELDLANSPIILARPNHNQALPLERTQQAADVGGIEPKPTSQRAYGDSLLSNLPQQSCFAKRMVSTQEVVV
jgi:hypothetical protein